MPDLGIGEAIAGGGLLDAIFGGAAAAAPEVAAASAPLDILAGGAAAGTADAAALGTTAAIGGGLGTLGGVADAGLGAGLDVSGIGGIGATAAELGSDVLPGAAGATSGVASPAVTGASAGASVAPGTGGLANIGTIDPTLSGSTLATLDPSLGQTGPTVADTFTSTDLGGGTFGAAPGAGGTAPFTPGATPPAPAAGSVFGPTPGVFDTGVGAPATPFAGVTGGVPPAGAVAPQGPGLLSSIGSTLKEIAPVAGVAGLGYNLLQGYESQQQLKALQNQETAYQNQIAGAGTAALNAAQPILSTGQALISGGPLPAPVQAMFDQYANAQRASIIQGYASRNQNTDPKQNSALQQDLNAVDTNLLALREQIGQQWIQTANTLLTQGVSATNIASQLPIMMQNLDIKLQQLTGNSIANFAAAMSGGTMKVSGQGSPFNINLNTNTTGTQVLP